MLSNCVRILVHRVRLVLVAVALSLLAAGGVFATVSPTQESDASVLFVPSIKQPGVKGPTNPLLSLGGSVAVVASVVQTAVSDEQTKDRLLKRGLTSDYEVLPDLSENAGPVLLVTTKDRDEQMGEKTRDALIGEIADKLEFIQDSRDIPGDLRVSSLQLTSSLTPTVTYKVQVQLAVIAAGGALAIALGLILLWDRRSKSKSVVGRHATTGGPAKNRDLSSDDEMATLGFVKADAGPTLLAKKPKAALDDSDASSLNVWR